ncbi:MAG: hypothetical protein KatS3mg034_1641 [Vicingaceae bacterium]|nr:MAG: hypothetical protein KatS3mg034_1641 [Vicingaceae bacterium]
MSNESLDRFEEFLPVFQNRQDLVEKTAAQIQKDFAKAGIELVFEKGQLTYQMLEKEMLPHLSNFLYKNPLKLKAIIYIIDLEEGWQQRKPVDVKLENYLVYEIIRREFLKVLIKEKFSR